MALEHLLDPTMAQKFLGYEAYLHTGNAKSPDVPGGGVGYHNFSSVHFVLEILLSELL